MVRVSQLGMFGRVHDALKEALRAAGIEMPYPTRILQFQVEMATILLAIGLGNLATWLIH